MTSVMRGRLGVLEMGIEGPDGGNAPTIDDVAAVVRGMGGAAAV